MDKSLLKYKSLFGLIGNPLTHSFSKQYFADKFLDEQIKDSYYELFPLESIKLFPALIKQYPNFKGINVTIPYKEAVIPYLDGLDVEALQIGAVNTIKFKNGELIGYNSDVIGFESSLMELIKGSTQKKALIFGTGGASKAIKFVLEQLGIPYQFVSRSPSESQLSYQEIQDLDFSQYSLLINTTPLGTYPNEDTFLDISYEKLTNKHYLYDLVYNPSETLFMKKGKEEGAKVKNGLDMLIGQAEGAWMIWNG